MKWWLFVWIPLSLSANPSGMAVRSGTAHCHQDGHTCVIEAGDRTILHWDQFSIGAGETTRFNLPHSKSAILNRVIGGSLSEIQGALTSNGQVFLINPQGILVGQNAVVNVASFFASTLDVCDRAFLTSDRLDFCGESPSSIVNLGTLTAWDGDVVLMAYHIDSQGSIHAEKGVAALAAGSYVVLQPAGSQRILIRADLSPNAAQEGVGIEHAGSIKALQVELKAEGNPYRLAIKESGSIDALSVDKQGGKIVLRAENGRMELTGSYVATHPEGKGGEIHCLAKEVIIQDAAKLRTVGGSHGGTILIGGDYRGKNPQIPNAEFVFVGTDVQIDAGASKNGDGGKVILWGNQATYFGGAIFAKGGMAGGNGGLIEVSSPKGLTFAGIADTQAPCGQNGQLLLDPQIITISTATMSMYSQCPNYYQNGSSSGNVNAATLVSCLNSNSSVAIYADQGVSDGEQPRINVNTDVTWTSNAVLTLSALDSSAQFDPGQIFINAKLNATGGGSVVLKSEELYIGSTTASVPTGVFTTSGGITINANPIKCNGGNTGISSAMIQSGSGNINMTCTRSSRYASSNLVLTLQGGTSALGDSSAQIQSTAGGSISINNFTTLNLQGNSGLMASAQIQTNAGGSIGISGSTGLNLTGGTGATSNAQILTNAGGSIGISGGTGLNLTGGTGTTSNAQILTNVGGDITIALTGRCQLSGGGSSGSSLARIGVGTSSGNVSITSSGIDAASGIFLKGGSNGGANAASLFVGTGGGNISLSAQSGAIQLAGGSGTASDASILTQGVGSLNLVGMGSQSLSLTGGTGGSSNAFIQTASGNLSIDISGDCVLSGGSGSSSFAKISSSGQLLFRGNNLTLQGGASGSVSPLGSDAIIETVGSSDQALALLSRGKIWLRGSLATNQNSVIQTTGLAGNNAIGIACQELVLEGSDIFSNASSFIRTENGLIGIAVEQDATLTGGAATGSLAQIFAQERRILMAARNLDITGGGGVGADAGLLMTNGNINVQCLRNCTLDSPNAATLARIESLIGNVTVNARQSITLSDYSLIGTSLNVLLKAGQNILLHNHSRVVVTDNDPATCSLTLVVDNAYPNAPLIGPGRFEIDAGALLQAGPPNTLIPLRIFTASPFQNTINETLNGVVYVAGPLSVDTTTERWKVYYPQTYYGDDGYTLFYKYSSVIPPPPPPPHHGGSIPGLGSADEVNIRWRSAFATSELFFDLTEMEKWVFDDFIHFSLFTVLQDAEWTYPNPEWMPDKGLSLQRARGRKR